MHCTAIRIGKLMDKGRVREPLHYFDEFYENHQRPRRGEEIDNRILPADPR